MEIIVRINKTKGTIEVRDSNELLLFFNNDPFNVSEITENDIVDFFEKIAKAILQLRVKNTTLGKEGSEFISLGKSSLFAFDNGDFFFPQNAKIIIE